MAKSKTKYVDGFVFVVPKKNFDVYKKMARVGAKVWLKHGALNYQECVGDDLTPEQMPGFKQQYFTTLTKAKDDELVCFSYIEFKSKKHRDSVNAKVMKEMDAEMEQFKDLPVPFDMKRFTYGGFSVIVGS
jgi:uncharacterized protein YbaA (DUF1428 family)